MLAMLGRCSRGQAPQYPNYAPAFGTPPGRRFLCRPHVTEPDTEPDIISQAEARLPLRQWCRWWTLIWTRTRAAPALGTTEGAGDSRPRHQRGINEASALIGGIIAIGRCAPSRLPSWPRSLARYP